MMARTPEREKEYQRARALRKHGLDELDYQTMLEVLGNVCGACGKPPRDPQKRRLGVDVVVEGEIRGFLCGFCRCYVALLRRQPWLIEKLLGAVHYVQQDIPK
jgi:hypothetical protein